MVNKENRARPNRANWRIIVDEATGKKVSHFFETKKGMVEPTCELFHKWKQAGKAVKAIRMDNTGENKTLVERVRSKDWKLNLAVEFMAKDTPQQNHLAKVGFATICNRGRAMLAKAKVPKERRHIVGCKAFETAAKPDGLMVVEVGGESKTRDKHWSGLIPKIV